MLRARLFFLLVRAASVVFSLSSCCLGFLSVCDTNACVPRLFLSVRAASVLFSVRAALDLSHLAQVILTTVLCAQKLTIAFRAQAAGSIFFFSATFPQSVRLRIFEKGVYWTPGPHVPCILPCPERTPNVPCLIAILSLFSLHIRFNYLRYSVDAPQAATHDLVGHGPEDLTRRRS